MSTLESVDAVVMRLTVAGDGANGAHAVQGAPIAADIVTVTMAGFSETGAQATDFKFASSSVQSFKVNDPNGGPRAFGKQVLAAFPVIVDHHADVAAYKRWWRDWTGYFAVGSLEGNKVMFGGSGQSFGRWTLDIVVLYIP